MDTTAEQTTTNEITTAIAGTDAIEPARDPSPAELLELIDEQRREIAELRSMVATSARHDSVVSLASPSPTSQRATRRDLLRRAGQVGSVAAGAAIGATLAPRPVAAADGEAMKLGLPNSSTTSTTLFGAPGSADANVLTVADAATASPFTSAIGGFGLGSSATNGVIGYSDASDAAGNTGHALIAYATSNARSNLFLSPELSDPREDTRLHARGEVVSDSTGDLWFCVESGAPGSWRRVTGVSTAGSFVPIDPTRVYDSRFVGGGDKMVAGEQRLIEVSDERSLVNGDVVTPDAIPFGATAVAYNLAVANTENGGYLFLTPGDRTQITGASINWSLSSPGPLNNGSVVKLGGDRLLRIFCEGDGATHVILDIVGYYL